MRKNKINFFILTIFFLLLSGCTAKPADKTSQASNINRLPAQRSELIPATPEPVPFSGEKGRAVSMIGGQMAINTAELVRGKAEYYNTALDNGQIVYFFVVQDSNGIYRAAANACQVCHDANLGFTQEGDYMVCNTCGNRYPLEKIATEKGGCNPIPINPDLKISGDNIILNINDFNEASKFF